MDTMSFFCTFVPCEFLMFLIFFFFNAPSTTEIYTLSLHDALPISCPCLRACAPVCKRLPIPTAENFQTLLRGFHPLARPHSAANSDAAIASSRFAQTHRSVAQTPRTPAQPQIPATSLNPAAAARANP